MVGQRKRENLVMKRSEGLVQRRVAQASNSNSSTKVNNDARDNGDCEPSKQFSCGDDNDDSKETRLTLMEEVLLLGLKDKEVGIDLASVNCYLRHETNMGFFPSRLLIAEGLWKAAISQRK